MSPRTLLGSAIVLAFGMVSSFVISTCVASRAYVQRGVQPIRENRTLTVTGSARKRIESNLALWKIGVSGEAKELQEAYRRLDEAETSVRGFLAEWKFPPGAISAGPIATETHFRRDEKGNVTRDVVAFELSRKFHITDADVGRVSRAAGEVTSLIKGGSRIEGSTPEYVYTGLQDLKVTMIGEATADARRRAELIATNGKCRLGGVREARAGVLQITPPWSTEVSSSGINDTSSIAKDVTSVVTLTIGIEAGP